VMITISLAFLLCTILTIVVWAWVAFIALTEQPSNSGYFDGVLTLIMGMLGLLGTAVIWLVYFIMY